MTQLYPYKPVTDIRCRSVIGSYKAMMGHFGCCIFKWWWRLVTGFSLPVVGFMVLLWCRLHGFLATQTQGSWEEFTKNKDEAKAQLTRTRNGRSGKFTRLFNHSGTKKWLHIITSCFLDQYQSKQEQGKPILLIFSSDHWPFLTSCSLSATLFNSFKAKWAHIHSQWLSSFPTMASVSLRKMFLSSKTKQICFTVEIEPLQTVLSIKNLSKLHDMKHISFREMDTRWQDLVETNVYPYQIY